MLIKDYLMCKLKKDLLKELYNYKSTTYKNFK